MATPTVRELVHTSATGGGNVTATLGAGTQIGDLLVCCHGCDFGTLANMTTPTSGTWTQQASADLGSNNVHNKLWTKSATASGSQGVTVNGQGLGEENYVQVYVISTGTWGSLDGTPSGTTSASGTSATAPSITTSTSDALLLCFWQSANNTGTWTAPSGMTNMTDEQTAGFTNLGTARQALTSSGSTGTKVATFSISSSGYTGLTIAIAGATATGSLLIPRNRLLSARLVR